MTSRTFARTGRMLRLLSGPVLVTAVVVVVALAGAGWAIAVGADTSAGASGAGLLGLLAVGTALIWIVGCYYRSIVGIVHTRAAHFRLLFVYMAGISLWVAIQTRRGSVQVSDPGAQGWLPVVLAVHGVACLLMAVLTPALLRRRGQPSVSADGSRPARDP